MSLKQHKQDFKALELPTKINATKSKLDRTLAIDSSGDDDVEPNYEKKVIFKHAHSGWKLQNAQKLEAMMVKLKKDITVVINCGENRNEAINEHHIFIRLDLLNTIIEQVIYIKETIKRGGTIFEETLFVMQKKTNDTLNKIREDVFKAYLKLGAEEKYTIARQGGQMTCIFTLLGIIERELHSAFGKISQAISKINEHRHKNNKAVTDLYTSFRSLPALKSSKQKSKERLTNNRKMYKEESCMDNYGPKNIPPDRLAICNKAKHNVELKHQGTDISSDIDLEHNSALQNSITTCLHKLREKLKNSLPTLHPSSENEVYEDCSSNPDTGHLEYKTRGFEISISDESIQIKIPTSVIYLVQNNNCKDNVKRGKLENLVTKETDRASLPTGSVSSISNSYTAHTVSEESMSSIYTDIKTDSEITISQLVKDNGFKNKTTNNCTKNNHKITNYDKCMPFFSENDYCNRNSQGNEIKYSIHSTNQVIDRKDLEQRKLTDIFSIWGENKNLGSEYGSKIGNLSNPLFGNILQIVDLIKKIYDNNPKRTFNHTENLEISRSVDKTNSIESTVIHCYDCPPSISLTSLEIPSIWKESASRLCELCPGCITLKDIK